MLQLTHKGLFNFLSIGHVPESSYLESVVEKFVNEHFALDGSLAQVIWIKAGKTPAIRLLEVNPETPPSGEVLSFYFPPSDEVPCGLYLAEIKPEEWQKVLQNEIPLPDGWSLENYQVFMVPA